MSDVLDLFPKQVIPEPNSGCWLWTENWNRGGYGTVYVSAARRQIMAHRHSYEISVGPIPEGLEIDHLCRQRCCVNPQHLEPVTQRENILRMAQALERERNFHCRNGHKRTEENTFVKPNGARVCNECRRANVGSDGLILPKEVVGSEACVRGNLVIRIIYRPPRSGKRRSDE